jgi:hypothetical protein
LATYQLIGTFLPIFGIKLCRSWYTRQLVVDQLFGAAENLEIGVVTNFVPFFLQKVVVVKEQFSGVDKNNFFCFHYRFVACFAP